MYVRVKTKELLSTLYRRGLTQNRFAMKVGITSGYCSQILRGVRNPSAPLCEKIVQELRTEFDFVFEVVDDQEEN